MSVSTVGSFFNPTNSGTPTANAPSANVPAANAPTPNAQAPAAMAPDSLNLSSSAAPAASAPAFANLDATAGQGGVSPGDASAEVFLENAVAAYKRGDGLGATSAFNQGIGQATTFGKALDFAEEATDLNQPLFATWGFARATDLAVASGDFNQVMTVAKEASRLGSGAGAGYALAKALDLCKSADQASQVGALAAQNNLPWVPDAAARKASQLPPATFWERFTTYFDNLFGASYHRHVPA